MTGDDPVLSCVWYECLGRHAGVGTVANRQCTGARRWLKSLGFFSVDKSQSAFTPARVQREAKLVNVLNILTVYLPSFL